MKHLKNIVRQENLLVRNLMQDDGLRLIDKMSRAVGTLKSCRLIQSSEAMDLLSLVRLAADFNMIPERFRGSSRSSVHRNSTRTCSIICWEKRSNRLTEIESKSRITKKGVFPFPQI